MAHFAELDENNLVKQVIVVHNAELMTDNGSESEQKGIEFCNSLIPGNWLQTSYNGNFRKNFAGIGFTYDPVLDAFIAPQPFPSWYLNEETGQWEPPMDYPTDGNQHTWDEASESWKLVDKGAN